MTKDISYRSPNMEPYRICQKTQQNANYNGSYIANVIEKSVLSKTSLTAHEVSITRRIFDHFDSDSDCCLSYNEARAALLDMGFKVGDDDVFFNSIVSSTTATITQSSDSTKETIVKNSSLHGSNTEKIITLEKFLLYCGEQKRIVTEKENYIEAAVAQSFRMMDKTNVGRVGGNQLRAFLRGTEFHSDIDGIPFLNLLDRLSENDGSFTQSDLTEFVLTRMNL